MRTAMTKGTQNGKTANRIPAAQDGAKKERAVQISAPKFAVAEFKIRGTTAYMQNKFSAKAREQIIATQKEGARSRKGKKRDPKNFEKCYESAMHISTDGWIGIPAAAFRAGMISACRAIGYKMTHAKLAINKILPDGYDGGDGDPLVRITKGKPKLDLRAVRNKNRSVDIRARPLWDAGWEATVRIRFDTEMLSVVDIANLFARVGIQFGIGDGRPDCKETAGMDLGQFEILN
jgi:hypothetical protein